MRKVRDLRGARRFVSVMPRLLLLPLTLLALAVPAQAQAAESFLGVLADGRAVRFSDDAPTGLTTPRRITGLAEGDRVVALAPGLALGRSGRVYRFDTGATRATGTVAQVALRGTSFSLLLDPARTRARVLSNAGQDVTVDVASGATAPGAGLRTTAGQPLAPAATLPADGRLAGVDRARGTLVTETAPGSGVATELPLTTARRTRLTLAEPMAFAVASGRGYLLTALPGTGRVPQSRFIGIDLASGATTGEAGPYFFRRLVALLPAGPVPDDTRPPRASIVSAPRRVSLRDLAVAGRVRFRLRSSEAFQVFASTAIGGRSNIGTLISRDTPGTVTARLPRLSRQELRLMRFRLGRTATFRASVRDWAGNVRTVDRSFRVVR